MLAKSRLPPDLLVQAYAAGYFPMPDTATNEIHWYRPDPRAVFPLEGFHLSRSLKKHLKKEPFTVTFDKAFTDVMKGCAARPDTWITDEFLSAYTKLHTLGIAHSVEVWNKDSQKLVGGVYGIALNGAFFAESKFHTETDASKAALYFLVEKLRKQGFLLLEVQFITPHLKSLGAVEISDEEYTKRLQDALAKTASFG